MPTLRKVSFPPEPEPQQLVAPGVASLKDLLARNFVCPLCFKPCKDTLLNPVCNHRFCSDCIKTSLRNKSECPHEHCENQVPHRNRLRIMLFKDPIFDQVLGSIQNIISSLEKGPERTQKSVNMPQLPDMLLYQQGPSNSSTTGTRTASTMNGHNKIIQIEGTKIDKRSNHSNPPTTASVQRRRSSTSSITTSPIVKRTKRKRSSSTKAADVDPANTKSNKYSFQSKSSFLVVRRTTNPPSQPCYSKKLQQKGPKREYSNAKCVRRIEKENFPIPP